MKQFRQQITFEEMRAEISRELVVRKRVYPSWIEQGRITRETADFRCLVFEALLFHLHEKVKETAPQKELFDEQK
jgi:hypothetical protein